MTSTCGQWLLEFLAAQGIDQVFGLPGNHTVELYRGIEAAGIRHITCRHEQGAAFMADGYARVSGRPGVCLLISGPGLLNAATAIAQARADSVPMLVISGVASRADLGMNRGNLHELPDQAAAARAFCTESHTLLDPDNLPALLQRAFARFQSGRPGPVHIEIPLDLMSAPLTAPIERQRLHPPGPDPDAIRAAAAELIQAQQPLIIAGGGARGASLEITRLAEQLAAPVLNTVNGKGVCAYGHPLGVGGSPSLPCLRAALSRSDRVLAIGTEIGETDYDLLMAGAAPDTGNWIRIDIDPQQLLNAGVPGLAISSDARLACAALLDALPAAPAPAAKGQQRADELRRAIREETHYHPEMQAFFDALNAAADDLVLIGDSTRPTYYAAWQFETRAPGRYFHSASGFGTLGYALPAAFGAAAATSAPVIGLIGDGGAQFTLPELTTGAQAALGVPIIVWNNEGYGEIENSMRASNVPVGSTRTLTPDFAKAAAAHRCDYANPRTLPALTESLEQALARTRPTLIEVREADFLTTPSGGWYR